VRCPGPALAFWSQPLVPTKHCCSPQPCIHPMRRRAGRSLLRYPCAPTNTPLRSLPSPNPHACVCVWVLASSPIHSRVQMKPRRVWPKTPNTSSGSSSCITMKRTEAQACLSYGRAVRSASIASPARCPGYIDWTRSGRPVNNVRSTNHMVVVPKTSPI
jgi:hypothetical protein